MFGLRRRQGPDPVERLHDAVVAASRDPWLYRDGGLPDTVEGRFESLTVHLLIVLRRLKALPSPAEDVAQDLVDMAFARLEVALRETGVSDVGVPKRMKKLAGAFYERSAAYDGALAADDGAALARALAVRLSGGAGAFGPSAGAMLARQAAIAEASLDRLLSDAPFPTIAEAAP